MIAETLANGAPPKLRGDKGGNGIPRDVTRVRVALRRRHEPRRNRLPEWCYFEELHIGTSWGKGSRGVRRQLHELTNGEVDYDPTRHGQRIDAFAIARYVSRNARRIAYEIKVARADFLSELRDPDKRAAGLAVSNEFYFVAPEGLIDPSEIPTGCGLIEVLTNGRTRQKVKAPWRDTPITADLLLAIARKASS